MAAKLSLPLVLRNFSEGGTILTLLTFVIIGLFFARAVSQTTDTYWHLAVGREIWQAKQIPVADNFVYGPKDNHFTSTEWLSAVIFYGFVKYFGFVGLTLIRVITGLLTIYLIYQTVKLITKNRSVLIFSSLVSAYVLSIRLFDRPEIFSYLFLALINFWCLYFYIKKDLHITSYLLPATFLLWPNIHPLVASGYLLACFFLVLIFFEKRFLKKNYQNLLGFTLTFIISSIFLAFQFKKSAYFLFIGQVTGFEITEFMSLFERLTQTKGVDFLNSISWYIHVYFAISIAYFFSLIFFLKKYSVFNLKFLLYSAYFIVLLFPILLFRLIQPSLILSLPLFFLILKEPKLNTPDNLKKIGLTLPPALLLLLILASSVSGYIIGSRETASVISLGPEAKTSGVAYRFWKPLFPEGSPEIINSSIDSKRLFTQNFWSSYFLWFDPKIKVFSDVMHEYRTIEDFKEEKILETGDVNWQELIEKHNIDTVVNSQFFVFYSNNTPVYTLPNWKLIYINDNYSVYAREDVIKSIPVELSVIHPELQSGLKFKPEDEKVAVDQLQKLLEFDPKNGFALQQLVQYWLDRDHQKAKILAEDSRKILPKDPIFSIHLAYLYARSGNCSQALEFGNEAKRKSFNHPIIKNEVHKVLSGCS